ncbi:MAG: alpha-1,2-fucosyltransferase [Candidatus Parcubacteria bacterium]|nr:alpha-1,2-fucosyltransferase [Candidatus Parcubacteria bacterium]
MIIVKLFGGIGNQMFQYALGRGLSLDQKTELAFDLSWYKNSPDRQFTLENFNISGKPITTFQKINSLSVQRIKESSFAFDSKILSTEKNVFLDGYWQSPKYFEGIEDILKKDFTLKDVQDEKYETLLKKISRVNSVSLHIRRGDYLSEKNVRVYENCPHEYYEKAIKYIKERMGDIELFVFSDDMDWVKKNIRFDFLVTFVSDFGFTDCQELILMSKCRHNITANSTFSWWGAWLNQNKGKIIVTPKKWFIKERERERDLIPSLWIKL